MPLPSHSKGELIGMGNAQTRVNGRSTGPVSSPTTDEIKTDHGIGSMIGMVIGILIVALLS